ncbi:MAG: protoporphyrinogen oxidase [Rhodobacteraceae bacterium]|jgi:menaquinone-dependent protoporphyrinogen oxidase|nr:protoporphyrinogen oxidase [Paracoccaceae bacterium]
MHILIGYATSEGQTQKIADFAAEHLRAHGHDVELRSLEDAGGVEPGRFDGVILAGSVHVGGYQKALTRFATDHAATLNAERDLFLSVSLTAAGDNAEDWAGLQKIIERFVADTGWTPDRIEHVAGAFRFTQYSVFEAWAMRKIAKARDPGIDTHSDTEYTDWQKLAAVLDDWAASLST